MIRPEEITQAIRKKIEGYAPSAEISEIGYVLSVGDGIARVYGIKNCMLGELVDFPNGARAIAFNLEQDNVGCVLLGEDALIKEGDMVKRTGRVMEVPAGENFLGRLVGALGNPLDGKGEIKA
ncbi:MAG: F0F1 ATP synthase subunit alpha, partial [Elusimicrobia bacterium]|nr:F0F1 ATP synthase subunit alpha [Elusimicrobiota bacterium]